MNQRFEDSFHAFSTAIELRFPLLAGGTEDAIALCERLANVLGLRPSARRRLSMAAHLRDIGLCSIPYGLLNEKPMDEWTQAENEVFSRHPEVGGAMLELVPSLRHLVPVVRCHHAPFDGSAGPIFPAGKDIPIEARILFVVTEYIDVGRSLGMAQARERIAERKGTWFDPEIVDAFLSVLTSERAAVYLHNECVVERVS